jgi:hypothetical protein
MKKVTNFRSSIKGGKILDYMSDYQLLKKMELVASLLLLYVTSLTE